MSTDERPAPSAGWETDCRVTDGYLEEASDLAVFLDPKGRIVRINRSGQEALGGPGGSSLVGTDWFDAFIMPEDRKEVRKVFAGLMDSRSGDDEAGFRHFRNRIVTISGRETDIEWHNRVVRDGDGRPLGILSVGRDISESERTIRDLKASEQQFRTLVETGNEIILKIDLKGKILYASPQVRRYGEDPDDMVGRSFLEFTHPDYRKPLLKQAMMLFINPKTNRLPAYDYIAVVDGGKRHVWMQVWSSPLYSDRGKLTGLVSVLRDIDYQHKTEARLKEVMENLTVGICRWRFGPEGRFEEVNPAALMIMDADSVTEALKTDFAELLPERNRLVELNLRLKEDRIVRGFEMAIRTLKGRERILSVSALLKDTEGGEGVVDGIMEDITDRQAILEQLVQEKNRFQSLFENSSDGIMIVDKERILECNQVTVRMFGFRGREEMVGRSVGEISPPRQPDGRGSQEAADELVERAFREGSVGADWTFRRPDGKDFLCDVRLNELTLGGKRVLQASVRDMTSERMALREIRESEERYRVLAESAPQQIVTMDAAGRIRYMNRHAMSAFGFRKAAESGGEMSFADAYLEADRPRIRTAMEMGLKGKVVTEEIGQSEEDGSRRTVRIVFAPFRNAEGKIDGVIAIGTDTSEMKAMRQKVGDLDHLKSQFMTSLLHVTRTPLNKIRWALEILLSGEIAPVSPAQETFIRQALSSDNSVIGVIESMTLALDIERGALSLDRTPTPLVSLIRSVARQFKGKHQADGVECLIGEAPEVVVSADTQRLRGVIETLLDNASRYLRETDRRIEVRILTEGDTVRCEVEDHGIGIPVADQSYVFERFFRGANAQLAHPDGLGLGLYIAKFVVERHGGSMGFRSREGEGSLFWFSLPIGE